jgi:hypothetical protein
VKGGAEIDEAARDYKHSRLETSQAQADDGRLLIVVPRSLAGDDFDRVGDARWL